VTLSCFTKPRQNNAPITRPLQKEKKAVNFHKEFNEGESDFTARTYRTDCREKRYAMRKLNRYEEKLSAGKESFFKFR
jgi:hypothetical protein